MSELIISGKKEYFTLSLLQFGLKHPSMSTPGYAIRLNPRSMELSYGPYFIALEEIFTELFNVIKKYKQLRLHMLYVPDKMNKTSYSRVLLFVSQTGKTDEQLIDILDACQVTDTYLFSNKQISEVVTLANGTHFRINIDQLSDELIYSDTFEIGKHEFSHFMSMLEKIRRECYVKTTQSLTRLSDGVFLGNDSREYPVYIENMSSLLIIGSDDIIPSVLNNRDTLPALVITRNTKEWENHRDRQGGVVLLDAGDGLPYEDQSTFGINLLGYCRENPGLVYLLFQKLKILLGGNYRDPALIYELVWIISRDEGLDKLDLNFSTLLSANTETDEIWAGSDLSDFTSKTDGLKVSYGEVLDKPFLQVNKGDLEYTGITVVDTSNLTEFGHTLICLVFLSLQEIGMLKSWLVLSDFDLMDNKKYKSDLENLFYYNNPNRLLLHFSKVYHTKSYYNKFKYSIFNELEKIPMKVKEDFGISNSFSSMHILRNQFDEFTLFTPVVSIVNMDNVLGPERSVVVEIKQAEKEDFVEEEKEDEVDEENYTKYLEGALISYLREGREYSFDEIVLHFEPVEEIDIPLQKLVEEEIVYKNEGYTLKNSTRRNINEMIASMPSASDGMYDDDEPVGLVDFMLDMEIKFHEKPQNQIIADLLYLLNLAKIETKEIAYGFDLFVGLYSEMLGEYDVREIIASFGVIIKMIANTLDKSGFETGDMPMEEVEFSDDINEMMERQKEIEKKRMREYQESQREDLEEEIKEEGDIEDTGEEQDNSEEEDVDKDRKEILVSEILKVKPETGLPNQPIHPDRLKPRFNGREAHGWVSTTEGDYSIIEDGIAARHLINPDVFILTYIALKADKLDRHKSALGIEYQKERYIIPLDATVDDMVDERLVSRKKKGIRANDLSMRFGYKLSGVHITDETYRAAMTMIKPLSVDELEEFYHSPRWRDKLRDIKPLERKPIVYNHPVFSQLNLLWRLSHYDTTMCDIDPMIMGIINLENLERKHLELLSIYFRLIHNQSIDKTLEGTTVDNPRLREVLKEIVESMGESKKSDKKKETNGLDTIRPHLKFKSDEAKVLSIPKAPTKKSTDTPTGTQVEKSTKKTKEKKPVRFTKENIPIENFFERVDKEEWERFDLGKIIENSQKGPLEKFREPEKVGLKFESDLVERIKNIEVNDVRDYLGDVLGIIISTLLSAPKSLPLNLLVFVFNRSGYESMVATTAFTEGLVSTIELFDSGKRKEGVLSAFREKIHLAVENLVYNDLFVERLEFHSKNIREE